MTVDASIKILVIILSATLALFLILAIVVAIKLIQISHSLRKLTKKAVDIADKAEAVTDFFSQASGPLAISRLLSNIIEVAGKKDKRGK